MKKLAFIILMILPIMAVQAQLTDEQKSLLDLEKQRTDAIASHNAAFLNNLFDDGFSGVNASGAIIHKPEQLEIYNGVNSFVQFTYEEVQATVYGSAAVVTGRQIAKSKTGSTLGQTRFMIIYSKLTDPWKVVMSQETDVIKK